MKTIQTTMSKTKYVLLALLVAFSFSCSPEDGNDGAQGPAGMDGTDGADGNANVQTFIFNSPSWRASSSGMKLNLTDVLTDYVIENDVILTYVKFPDSEEPSIVPGKVFIGGSFKDIFVSYGTSTNTGFPTPQHIGLVCFEENGNHTPNANLPAVEWVKVIIIESTNTTTTEGNGRVMSGKEAVMHELQSAGIDLNNYDAVCSYYGIAN
ncbi:hypothetical protein [Xanthomarina sp. F2636L]|uniref:hypothetical protein n=1 Tax=Xanthomarina sp. F2636L TaxID=2996018 RepID=UPI00225E2617|nr:hypothetical protein [Xanthomarina sp. F2636L]MCX7550667.1 hypothetical protein [Xanthomarina sp. F2636L]